MQKYPILQTAEGPDYLKPAKVIEQDGNIKEYLSHFPINEEETFTIEHKGMKLTCKMWLRFYTDKNLATVELLKIE